MWSEIFDNDGIENLMNLYGGFHDSCLRDFYISTCEFVDEELAMHFDNILIASLLFQRQFRPNSVLELKIENVKSFFFQPMPENYNGVIYGPTLKFENDLFYWADFPGWNYDDWKTGDTDVIWVSGQKLFWRVREELIGNISRLKD